MRPLIALACVVIFSPSAFAQYFNPYGGSTPAAWQQFQADRYAAMRMQMQAQAISNNAGIRVPSPDAYGAYGVYGNPGFNGYGNNGIDESYGYQSYGSSNSQYATGQSRPWRAENGDYRNVDNDFDGRREPTHVQGYWRRDGIYTRGHYRAMPRW